MNMVLLWGLTLSDDSNSLLDISGQSGLFFDDVESAAGGTPGKELLSPREIH